jgi:hypothetical protein
LEPDDMMAIKLLAPKLQKCLKIYVVLGEHTTCDIIEKCKLFYILANNYGFREKIHSDNGKICMYQGYESSEQDKEYPSTIFDYLRTNSLIPRDYSKRITIVDLKLKENLLKFNNKLNELKRLQNPIIFLLMKPPKELFYLNGEGIIPLPERILFENSLAFMYGSFNKIELNKFLLVKEIEKKEKETGKVLDPKPENPENPINLSDITTMFPKIVYIERKPEIASYNDKKKEKDPNPFFGYLDDNITKVLEDNELPKLMRESYTKIITNDSLLEYCTINWQLDALSSALKKLGLIDEFEKYEKRENETEVQQLIGFFKSKFFKDRIDSNSNMVETGEGYYAGIFYDEKIKQIDKTKNVTEIIEEQKKKAKHNWGMMVGIVLADGKQTPLADQIIAALILEPKSFTLKKMTRDNVKVFTIVINELDYASEKIEDLKNEELNTKKIILYKLILNIIKEQSRSIQEVSYIGGYKKHTKKYNKKKNQKKTRSRQRSRQRSRRRYRRRAQYKSKK